MAIETLFVNPLDNHESVAPIKVIIADDHKIFMSGIAGIIDQCPDVELCGSFLNGKDLLDWYTGSNADVILLDIHMPVLNGIETSKQLLSSFPEVKIIILSVDNDLQGMKFMFNLGVYAYLLKDIEPEQFIQTILKVYSGEKVFPENFSEKAESNVRILDHMIEGQLSAREIEVIKLIAKGKSNREIAVELNISASTVKKHRENMIRKMGATNMVQLILNVSFKGFFK